MSSDGDSAATPRVNPFVLPAATTGQFLLLLVTALASAAYLYGWLVSQLDRVSGEPAYCARTAREYTAVLDRRALSGWYGRCIDNAGLRQAILVCWLLGALVVVSVLGYLVMPWWIRRGLRPLSSLTDRAALGPAAVAFATTVAVLTPGRRRITLWTSTGNAVNRGRAFGAMGRYHIAVDHAEFMAPAGEGERAVQLDGIARHEIAHIRNRDIDLTYLAISCWWAYLLAVVVPFAALAAREPGLLLALSWRLGVLLLLLWLARSAVLRTREFYADLGAADHPAAEATMRAVLLENERRPRRRPAARWPRLRRVRRLVGALVGNHPTDALRLSTLDGGDKVFRPRVGVALTAGALVGLGYSPLYQLATVAWPDSLYLRGWLVGAVFGLLAGSVLTGSLWRATLFAAANRAAPPATGPTALAFAAALLATQAITPDLPVVSSWGALTLLHPAVGLAVAALLALGCFGYLAWVRLCASTWLPAVDRPARAYRIGVLLSTAVGGLWLSFWFLMLEVVVGGGGGWGALAVALFSIAVNPVLLVGLVCAGLAPMLARPIGARRGIAGLWRPPDRNRPQLLAGTTLSIGTPLILAGGLLLGYAVAVLPFYPRLGAATRYAAAHPSTADPGRVLAPIGVPLALAALLALCIGGFAAGFWHGGQGRTTRTMAVVAVALVPFALGAVPLSLIHVSLSVGQPERLPVATARLMSAQHGIPTLGAYGIAVLLAYAAGLLLCVPAALLGSGARAVVARRPTGETAPQAPARGRPAGLATTVSGLILTAIFGYLTLIGWTTIGLTGATVLVGQDDRTAAILRGARPGSISLAEACATVLAVNRSPSLTETTGPGLAYRISTVIAAGLSADDATLHALAEVAVDDRYNPQAVTRDIGLMEHYCASS